MIDRPSDGMGLDELREEFDWISEFQSRMAERICGDADVHNLVDYVGKLERENAKLRELVARMAEALGIDCEWADPDWCKGPCALEFGCWPEGDHTDIRCPAWAAMHELGVTE